MPKHARRALSLAEVLVLLMLAAIMVCLLLPALLRGRDRARSNYCRVRLETLVKATHRFESVAGHFPSGTINPKGPVRNVAAVESIHHNWISQLLPFLDEEQLFARIDPDISVYADKHSSLRSTLVSAVVCPAAPPPRSHRSNQDENVTVAYASSYAGCYHDDEAPIDAENNGVFFLNSKLTQSDIADGLQYTLFLGEIRSVTGEDLGWMSGTRATLRNTGHSPNAELAKVGGTTKPPDQYGGFGSWHAGFSHMAMGAGDVRALSDAIDPHAFRQMGNRHDGTGELDRLHVEAESPTP